MLLIPKTNRPTIRSREEGRPTDNTEEVGRPTDNTKGWRLTDNTEEEGRMTDLGTVGRLGQGNQPTEDTTIRRREENQPNEKVEEEEGIKTN